MIKNEAASKNSDWDYFWVEGNHEHKFAVPKKYELEIPYDFEIIPNGWVRENLQKFGILRLKTPRPPNWVRHVGGLNSNLLRQINDAAMMHGDFVRAIEVAEFGRRHQLMRMGLEMAQNQREFKILDRTYRKHWTDANMKKYQKLLKTIISMKKKDQRYN